MPSWLRRLLVGVLGALLTAAVVVHALALHYGLVALTTFLLLIGLVLAGSHALAAAWLRRRGRADAVKTLRLLLASLFVALVGAELVLRHAVGRYASYSESKGAPTYLLQDREPRLQAAIRRLRGNPIPARYWVAEPNSSSALGGGTEYAFLHHFNSLGLPGAEPPRDKPAGELRIVAVGDSFTEGIGAEELDAWPSVLERELAAARPERPIRVLNAGKAASDPCFGYVLLAEKLLDYSPDLVLVAVNESDIDDLRLRGGMQRFQPDGSVAYRPGPRWEWLYGSSYLVRHIVHDVLGYDRTLLRPEVARAQAASAQAELEGVLRSFAALARERGFELVLIFHPIENEVETGELELAPVLASLRGEPGVRVLDLLAFYRGPDGMPPGHAADFYWPIDRHHNAQGYQLFARGVASALRSWDLVD